MVMWELCNIFFICNSKIFSKTNFFKENVLVRTSDEIDRSQSGWSWRHTHDIYEGDVVTDGFLA